jgi:hypothetical protein
MVIIKILLEAALLQMVVPDALKNLIGDNTYDFRRSLNGYEQSVACSAPQAGRRFQTRRKSQ